MQADPERRDNSLHILETCAILFSLARSKPRQSQGEKENDEQKQLETRCTQSETQIGFCPCVRP